MSDLTDEDKDEHIFKLIADNAELRARHEKLREGLRSARRGNPTTDIHGCAYVHDDPNDPNGEYIRASDVDALLEDE